MTETPKLVGENMLSLSVSALGIVEKMWSTVNGIECATLGMQPFP